MSDISCDASFSGCFSRQAFDSLSMEIKVGFREFQEPGNYGEFLCTYGRSQTEIHVCELWQAVD
jgi:hypothetical protein